MSDLRARLLAALAPVPSGSLVPRDWVMSLLDGPEPDAPDLVVSEVAQLLGRGDSTVRTMLIDGRLKGYRLNGREWRVPRAALRALRDGPQPTPNDSPPVELSAWRDHLQHDAPPTEERDGASNATGHDRQDRGESRA